MELAWASLLDESLGITAGVMAVIVTPVDAELRGSVRREIAALGVLLGTDTALGIDTRVPSVERLSGETDKAATELGRTAASLLAYEGKRAARLEVKVGDSPGGNFLVRCWRGDIEETVATTGVAGVRTVGATAVKAGKCMPSDVTDTVLPEDFCLPVETCGMVMEGPER